MAKQEDSKLPDLGLTVESAPAEKLYKGKPEYAPPYYTINIAFVEHMPEHETIQCNGEAIQIRRGENVDNVPEAFVEILRKAIGSRLVRKRDRDGKEFQEWQPYPAIPYQIVEGPYKQRKIQE